MKKTTNILALSAVLLSTISPTSLAVADTNEVNTNTSSQVVQDSSNIQPMPLNEVFPQNAEAQSSIANDLGISITDTVTQEQLDEITSVQASQISFEGFQYLHNLHSLYLDSGQASPDANIPYIQNLTSLSEITFDFVQPSPGFNSKEGLDLSKYSALKNLKTVNMIGLPTTMSGFYFKDNVASPLVGLNGEILPFDINSVSGPTSFDLNTGTYQFDIADGASMPIDLFINGSTVSNGVTYNYSGIDISGQAYGKLVITSIPEITYDAGETVNNDTFLQDINASFTPNDTSLAALTSNIDSQVDLSTPGTYTVTLNTTLAPGISSKANADPITVLVHVVSVKAADVTVKYEDTEGKEVADFETLTGNIGQSYSSIQKDIPGYVFKEIQGNANGTFTDQPQVVTYIYSKDQTIVNVHNSTIYVGDNWTAEDNFDSALDKDGNTIDFSQLTIDDSQVDTNTPGTYDVTYTYEGVTSTAKVTVKAKQTPTPKPDQSSDTGQTEKSKESPKDTKSKPDDSNKGILPETGESSGMIFSIIGSLILGLVSIAILFKKKELKK